MKTAILVFIVFSISIAATLFQEDLKHHLRHKNAEQVALMLASMTEKSGDITEVKNYIDLLDNSQAMNGVGCDVKIQDFAVSALEQQTGVKASKSNQSIKAILSCYKNEQVYRYHILELNQTDIQKYKYKVSKWLMTQLAN